MRRVGFLAGIVLAGGVWAASATAAPASDHTHLAPASTSAPVCAAPAAAPTVNPGPGGTAVTFVLVAPGCE